jgi:hypothetical protein
VANDPTDPEHTIFWLAVPDQSAKRGIDCPSARERALNIILDGADLAAMKALGMDDKSLRSVPPCWRSFGFESVRRQEQPNRAPS